MKSDLKRIGLILGSGLVLLLMLSACENLPFELPWLVDDISTPALPTEIPSEMTPTPEMDPGIAETPSPVTTLTIWVPPELDPGLDEEANRLFVDQLQAFSDANNGLEVIVRVKAASGAGGLLDGLTATNAAAPDALPDLILLSRPDLETAALKGLIFSLDGLTTVPDDPDLYAFSREMALIQGSTFGLPFATDALALVYRPNEDSPEFPLTWSGLFEEDLVLAFPSEQDQALFPMTLYLAEGGPLQDSQRRPTLEVEPLSSVFGLFQSGVEVGTFPDWLTQYQTFEQVWTAFQEGQVDLAVAWVSDYLKDKPENTFLFPLFPGSEGAVSIGTGLSWAVATPLPERQQLAIALAEFLIQSDFSAQWTFAAGYMPAHPSSLEGWQSQNTRNTISQVALMTRLRPPNDIILSLGPILRDGTRQILQQMADPAQAAESAIESLGE